MATTAPRKYTKRPVSIEAIQWDGKAESAVSIINWIISHGHNASYECVPNLETFACSGNEEDHVIKIRTLEGDMTASAEDWIIRGVQGEFYPCKPDIFEATYNAAD